MKNEKEALPQGSEPDKRTPAPDSTVEYTQQNTQKAFSIVVPTLNEEDFISGILSDIAASDTHPTDYEVIVADSGSADGTREIVRKFTEKNPGITVHFLEAEEKGPSIARNTGAEKASGEYVFFFDADSRLSKNLLKKSLAEMKKRELDAAGFYLSPTSGKWHDRAMVGAINQLLIRPLQYTTRPLMPGVGLVIKKELHETISGFDPTITYGEDLDYLRRAAINGKFRILTGESIGYSMRRYDEEGRINLWTKNAAIVGYNLFSTVKNASFSYNFGQFSGKNREK